MNIYVKLAEFRLIETRRLILRPFVLSDAEEMFAYSGNPENLKFVFAPHLSLEETRFAIANNYMKNPLGKWAIELKAEHKLIGDIHFVKISEKNQSAEIGYVLNQNYWNQGLLTEFSFEQFALKKLELLIDKENPASKKVALKSGYQMVKKFKGSNQYSAKIRNFEQYEQRKNDYEIYRKKSEIGEI
ncbi:SSU ribosomal protein S5P alanine acetyltransferase [Lactococcus cremoris subsp. cremoris SK11]|uniref:SSU ribosomal protein S5P alanine acetyltransferase n=2 Tax=Lactococcus lactis subsp. cremoris TaxID=1359 RepID=Q030N9_LACLS|nr:GNAT family N-acetyltransferase [Lactococcus cremoris]ABJ72333.1 SSU ribosomal protein S5P alanine acetyltransferase [Lactococcus cremoris subsp. cremoris SK11]ARE22930.1 GNAT family N-acetyltransferase [Lactococcus cremoris]KZK44527.1 Ribosomal-protein-S5p-alanine acetyltransferase [Lactococcus cremoris]KZK55217.1 Ribosomal-protein-S5p-alanine acetyltransferase [Lactococcus cremoris]MCT4408112.1 N-acetyltransferase [Lactococcus cremoris]